MSDSTVVQNMKTVKNYAPYCCKDGWPSRLNRMVFNGDQFECNYCGLVTNHTAENVEAYKAFNAKE